MDIAFYIAELLQQHNEVNVPGLGTFSKLGMAGFHDQDKDVFYPPSQRLEFKANVGSNPILAEYISFKKNILTASADYFIENFVSTIHNLLETSQYADIMPLGTLQKKDQFFKFKSYESFNEQNDFYGLKPIAEQKREVVKIEKPIIYSTEKIEIPDENSDTLFEDETEQDEPRKMGFISKIAIVFAVLILITGVVYFFYPKAFNLLLKSDTTVKQKSTIIPVKKEGPKSFADSMAKADTIYAALKKQGFDVEKPRDTIEVSTKKAVPNKPGGLRFEIIGAAFNSRTEADDYIKSMKLKGIEAKIADEMPGPMIKISLGTFNDRISADKELIRIKKDINQEAWIARVKPKKTN